MRGSALALILLKLAVLGLAVWLAIGATAELYEVAWGTGNWYGEFSVKWGTGFALFCLLELGLIALLSQVLWGGGSTAARPAAASRLPRGLRWIAAVAVALVPVVVLQYSPWGVVFDGPFIRLELWLMCIVGIATLMRFEVGRQNGLRRAIAGTILAGSVLLLAAAFTEVTDYPFSLGWSEGNRLWDYSLLFGKNLYSYDVGQAPVAYLDIGRQIIGGLPFLLPRVSIFGVRAWLAVVSFLPALLVGILTFMPRGASKGRGWMLAALAGWAFLSQGPIHAPLLVCAALVATAWRVRTHWAVPLLILAGYFAAVSRFTWIFAPAMWIAALELGSGSSTRGGLDSATWRRAILLGCAGLLGAAIAYSGVLSWSDASTGTSAGVSTSQALLWYRLLPNATYGEGVVLGLLKAALPLAVLIGWASGRYWRPNWPQAATVVLSLLAFLGVGLIVSTKIGGGGDLHNLDMFLIGVLFAAGLAWRAGGDRLFDDLDRSPNWIVPLLVVAVALPYYGALRSLRPLEFSDDLTWLTVLTDVERARDLGSLPGDEITDASLEQIRAAVSEARGRGEVLLMDQRQLLTFGYLRDLKLVSEYEKKRMMDEALSGNAAYFEQFYADLAAKRFSLVVSSPLRTPIKDSEYGFGEENNAWVEWIARPVLCYYAEQDTLNEAKVELLVPKDNPVDCTQALPAAAR